MVSITEPATVTKKGKVGAKIVYLKLAWKKSSERGRKDIYFDIFRSIYFTGKVTERPFSSVGNLVLCYMEILRASCFRDKKPLAIRARNRSLDTRDDGSIFIRKWKGANAGQRTRLGKQVKLVRKPNQSIRLGEF